MRGIIAGAFALTLASASGRADARPLVPTALTALDDARACAPLARGGFAVATGGGLAIVRRDARPVVLTSLDGLPDTRIHAVLETADGLWVGTEGGAALVSSPDASPRVARTAGEAPVHALLASGSGLYVGTWGEGLFHLADKDARPARVASSAPGTRVAALAAHDGSVHVAFADASLARLDPGGTLRPVPGTPSFGQALASSSTRLVLGSVEGLSRIDKAGPATELASVDARGLAASGDALLVGTYGAGLFTVATGRSALRPEQGVPRWVLGVGARGAARCAATTEGLFVDEGAGFRRVALGGPPSNDVTVLAPGPSGDVLVGTFDRGAAVYERGSIEAVGGLEPHETVNAAVRQGGTAWLGTAHGVVRVDGKKATLRVVAGLPSTTVRALLVLSSGRLLAGTDEGPAFVDGERASKLVESESRKAGPRPLASPMHATWALAEGRGGTLFIGTASGLYWGTGTRFERASVAGGELRDDWVTALAVRASPEGEGEEVFVGTYSAGVTKLVFRAGTGRPRAVHLDAGYVNPNGLTFDGDQLLVATMDGLTVRPLADDRAKGQLLPSMATGRDVTAAVRSNGALWVASRRGVVVTPGLGVAQGPGRAGAP